MKEFILSVKDYELIVRGVNKLSKSKKFPIVFEFNTGKLRVYTSDGYGMHTVTVDTDDKQNQKLTVAVDDGMLTQLPTKDAFIKLQVDEENLKMKAVNSTHHSIYNLIPANDIDRYLRISPESVLRRETEDDYQTYRFNSSFLKRAIESFPPKDKNKKPTTLEIKAHGGRIFEITDVDNPTTKHLVLGLAFRTP
ncbi:MAG: hypothetical protein ACOXZ0_08370 [Eubacteriales bacterium]